MEIVSDQSLMVHRRTGGLEKIKGAGRINQNVHRRTGGLEIYWHVLRLHAVVHRRTGGLEMLKIEQGG